MFPLTSPYRETTSAICLYIHHNGVKIQLGNIYGLSSDTETLYSVSNSTINLYMHHNDLKMSFGNMYKLSFDIETL